MLVSFLNRLTIPLSLLAIALLSRELLVQLPLVYRSLLSWLPYIIFSLTLLLALYFNRARQFAMAASLLLVYVVIESHLQVSIALPKPARIYGALSIGIPLAALLLQFLPEKGLRNIWGLAPLLAALAPGLIAYLLLSAYPRELAAFLRPWQPGTAFVYYLSLPASAAYLLMLLSSLWTTCKRNSEYSAAVFSLLLFTFSTLAFFNIKNISLIMFTAASIAMLAGLVRSTHELAFRDELTGLRSRRALNERIRSLGGRFVIAMADIDHFKQCNDQYGHDVGDNVLQMVATHLNHVKGGTAYRYGGEEFCLLFAGKNREYCEPVLETMRKTIGDYRLYLRDIEDRPKSSQQGRRRRRGQHKGESLAVTVSIGAAERGVDHANVQAVIKAADTALYQAKKKGRNRLVFPE